MEDSNSASGMERTGSTGLPNTAKSGSISHNDESGTAKMVVGD